MRPFLDGYAFTTAAGVEHFLLFRPEGTLFPQVPALHDAIFSVLFFPLSGAVESGGGNDDCTMSTVVAAIRERPRTAENVVMYVTDDSDGRSATRGRLFERLFHQQPQQAIELIAGAIQKEGRDIASAMLIHRSNPWKGLMVDRFFELLREYSKD